MSEVKVTGKVLDISLFKRVLGLAKPVWRTFALVLFLAILISILAPLKPHLVQTIIDDYILKFDSTGLKRMCLFFLGVIAAETFVRYNFIYYIAWLGQSIIKDLRARVFKHIISLRLRFFDNTPIGTATTRAINDVEAINDVFSQGVINIIADVLTILVVLGMMLSKDWLLTLICLTTFPFFLYATYVFKEGIKVSFQTVRKQVAEMNAFLQERISGMAVVQVFNAEDREKKKFEVINGKYKDANVRAIWYYSIFFPVVEIIQASALGLLVWFGANQVLDHQATLGILMAFILYLNMLFRPLRMIADRFNTLQMGLVAAERVFNILDNKEQIQDTGKLCPDTVKGAVEFNKVWFAYNEVDFVLKDVSFKIEPGKSLAIVGATGAGKSSVINILNRFYGIQKGSIKVDGESVRDYELDYLRSKIGLVLQDVFLFSGSIMENVTLRNPDISKEKVVEAAKLVGAHEFIMKLPGQYDFDVMERGATLSMGQRQLLSFIRTLVFDPTILILDEATSSIDTETEQLVQNAIDTLMEGRTAIVIAHRLSTIQKADQIMVLDKGEVKEIGSHEELLATGTWYKELHDMQFQSSQRA